MSDIVPVAKIDLAPTDYYDASYPHVTTYPQ